MNQIPWHSLLVHLPITLAILIPVTTLILWFLNRPSTGSIKVWRLIPLLATLHLFSTYAAQTSGQSEFKRIAPLISDDAYEALEAHSELGEKMVTVSLVVWGLSMTMLLLVGQFAWIPLIFAAVSLLGSVPVLILAHSGAELVYVHGLSGVGNR